MPIGDVERVFVDFSQRRSAILRALTDEVDALIEACDPQKANLCLYGNPDGTWAVGLPAQEVPPELPEPVLGINFPRDIMDREDWITLIAAHSDVWLLGVAFWWASTFTSQDREKLFKKCNSLPTIREVVTRVKEEPAKPPAAEKPPIKRKKQAKTMAKASGRLLKMNDITLELKGAEAETYWPDDDKWYQCEVTAVNTRQKTAKVLYKTGETEELNLPELIAEDHVALLN